MASNIVPETLYEALFKRRGGISESDLAKADPFVREALSQNKHDGLLLAVRARWVALAITAVLVLALDFSWESLYYVAAVAVFALLGWAQLRAGSVAKSRRELFLLFLDLVLITLVMLVPNPLRDDPWPTAFQYHLIEFGYFYIFLAAATLAYSWRTLIAFGVWTAAIWLISLGLVVAFGSQVPELTDRVQQAFAGYDELSRLLDPNQPLIPDRIQEVVVLAIVAGILALNGRRNSRLVFQQANVARERANLARHFPPTIVDQMAEQDQPLGDVRSQDVAVMFVDIVGFTRLAEQREPHETVALLRQFHARLEAKVFEYNGTLDKFLGDGLMATFGTPAPSPHDAANALSCGRAILADMAAWNEARQQAGEVPIRVSVGVHYGPVVLGDIGSERRLEYAVLGDTVNVASRLEALTRNLGCGMVASDKLVQAVRHDNDADPDDLLTGFKPGGPQSLRGRAKPMEVWKV